MIVAIPGFCKQGIFWNCIALIWSIERCDHLPLHTHTDLMFSLFSEMLKSGAFVSEPQQSYNATWRTLEPSEPKGKSNYNNIKWIIFHLQKEFYDWTCDHFNLSLICFNSVFRRLWPGQTTSRTLAFQMTFLIWMTSQYWYVDLYYIRWLFINNFFSFDD